MKYSKNNKLNKSVLDNIEADKIAQLESLRGQDGRDGEQGSQGLKGDTGLGKPGMNGESGRDGARGPAGPQGPKGDKGDSIKGEQGSEGDDGKGIADIKIIRGQMVIIYTDGSRENLGNIVGPPGQRGLRGQSGPVFTGSDTGFPWYRIPAGKSVEVPINRQHLISGDMIIEGEFLVKGEAVAI